LRRVACRAGDGLDCAELRAAVVLDLFQGSRQIREVAAREFEADRLGSCVAQQDEIDRDLRRFADESVRQQAEQIVLKKGDFAFVIAGSRAGCVPEHYCSLNASFQHVQFGRRGWIALDREIDLPIVGFFGDYLRAVGFGQCDD
jgi:hypothetical protein